MAENVTVYNPEGIAPDFKGVALAPRPATLEGKTVALVDVGFENSGDFIAALEKWFAEHRSDISILTVHMKTPFFPDPETYEKVAQNADAVVFGIGQCSGCAPATATHAARLEAEYGVPSVAVHADAFERLVRSTSKLRGIPEQRHAFVASPVSGRSIAELTAYIEGLNPVTGRPFADDMIDALTAPLTEKETAGEGYTQQRTRYVTAGRDEDLHDAFRERGWTDGLPIVLPTRERVEAMLAGTSHAPDEIVGKIKAASARDDWEFTVEQAAVNAVMAGAKPEYFPVILALLGSGYSARHSSISSMAEMVLINGPIRDEIGLNSGIGALGPYSHANTTIGRAYGLASQNLQGGSEPGISYMGALGNPFSFTSLTIAEAQEASPWEPYHVQQGFAADDSVATIFVGVRTLITGSGIGPDWRERAAEKFGVLSSSSGAILLLTPPAARDVFEHEGFSDKRALSEWLSAHATVPAHRWWKQGLQELFFKGKAEAGEEPWASYLRALPDGPVPLNLPAEIHVVVVGGETTPAWAVITGVANGPERERKFSGRTVSIDAWR